MSAIRPHAEPTTGLATVVLEVKGLHWATEKAVVDNTLRRRDGVRTVEANPVSQTATVSYEPDVVLMRSDPLDPKPSDVTVAGSVRGAMS